MNKNKAQGSTEVKFLCRSKTVRKKGKKTKGKIRNLTKEQKQ